MNFNIVKAVFYKEVKDTLRDSKTLVVMILLPIILYPLLSIGAGQILIQQGKRIQENDIVTAINKEDNSLYTFLSKKERVKLVHSDAPQKDLKRGKINAYIELSHDFNTKFKQEKTADVHLYFDQANLQSLNAYSKLTDFIKEYKKSVLEDRIVKKGLDLQILNPFIVYLDNIAPKERVGGFFLGNILPFLIIFMTILGAFYPAIDQTAGEKERGTLETLFTTPVRKSEIITGKFLTVSLFAFISGVLNLGSMVLSMNVLVQSDKIAFSIPWDSMLLILLGLIPTTVFFVALMMLVASLANSFKDAQNYLTPVYLICGFPAMVTIFPGFVLDAKTALIPIANMSLLFKEFLLQNYDLELMALVFTTTTIYSVLTIAAATKLFNREDVIFSEESNVRLIFSNSEERFTKTPNFMEAVALYIISFGGLFYLGSPIQTYYKLNGVLVTELCLVLMPAILFTRYLKFDYKETLSLKKISLTSVTASILLALSSSFFVLKFVTLVQDPFFPMPEEFKKSFEYFLMENGKPVSFFKIFFVIAISAAVCEEFLFRGPLLSGMKSKFSKKQTIFIIGLLFGIFHMNLYRLLPTSLLGMLITYLTLSTGSIFSGMIFHLVNNGSAVIFSEGLEKGTLWFAEDSAWYYYPLFFIVFIISIYLIEKESKNITR